MPDMRGLKGPKGMLRKVFDNMADGVLVADLEKKRFCSCNTMMCKLTGYEEKELLALTVSDIHPEKDFSYVVDQFVRQSQQEFTLARDIPVLRKDGRIFYADVNSIPMTFEGREYLVGIFRDITGRKENEKNIKEREEHLKILVEAIPDLMFRLDADGRFVDYKAESVAQLFVPPEQFLGRHYQDVLPIGISQRLTAAIEDALDTGKLQFFEYRITPPDMGEQFYEARVVAVKGEYCVTICRNITESKSFEEQLKKSAADLKTKQKALEQKNITLKEVIGHVESEIAEIRKNIAANISRFIQPTVQKLKRNATPSDMRYLDMLDSNLRSLSSNFGTKLAGVSFSAREMEICNMIKNGLSTKDIANTLKISLRTVDTFRNRIRKNSVYLQRMSTCSPTCRR